jgi:hypothetical protein
LRPVSRPEGAGDTWTWTALDAEGKMIVSYLVRGRDAEYASRLPTKRGPYKKQDI